MPKAQAIPPQDPSRPSHAPLRFDPEPPPDLPDGPTPDHPDPDPEAPDEPFVPRR